MFVMVTEWCSNHPSNTFGHSFKNLWHAIVIITIIAMLNCYTIFSWNILPRISLTIDSNGTKTTRTRHKHRHQFGAFTKTWSVRAKKYHPESKYWMLNSSNPARISCTVNMLYSFQYDFIHKTFMLYDSLTTLWEDCMRIPSKIWTRDVCKMFMFDKLAIVLRMNKSAEKNK